MDYRSTYCLVNGIKVSELFPLKNGSCKHVRYFTNGVVESITFKKDNKLHGPTSLFYENLNIKAKLNYFDGKFHGAQTEFFENGNVKKVQFYLLGNPINKHVSYHENKNEHMVTFYKSGKKHGISNTFFEDGSIQKECYYIHGKEHGTFREYHPNGCLQLIRYYNYGKKKGMYREFYDNKQLKILVRFDSSGNKKGNLKIFYKCGNIKQISPFRNDKRHGREIRYHQNGKKSQVNFFHEEKFWGVCLKYNKDESLKMVHHYKNGKLHGLFQKYNEVGNIEGQYMNGLLDGKIFFYGDNFEIKKIKNFRWGRQVGVQYENLLENKLQYYKFDKHVLSNHKNKNSCSVCYEDTCWKTEKCGHDLCEKCLEKLKKAECPYCRQNFLIAE